MLGLIIIKITTNQGLINDKDGITLINKSSLIKMNSDKLGIFPKTVLTKMIINKQIVNLLMSQQLQKTNNQIHPLKS